MLIGRYYMDEIRIVILSLIAVFGLFGLLDLLSLFIFPNFARPIIGVIVVTILSFAVILKIWEYFRKKIDVITFTPLWIEIGKETPFKINYSDIQKVAIIYWFQKKDFDFSLLPATGHENTIKIITKDGKRIVKNIRIENNADYWRFRSLGDFLKEKGVEVEMKGFSRSRLTWKAN